MMKVKTSKIIQAEVDKKNGSDLRDIADLSFSSNDYDNQQGGWREMLTSDVVHFKNSTIDEALKLATKLRKMEQKFEKQVEAKPGTLDIYRADYNDALGPAYVYFVGTVQSILRKLSKLGNDNGDFPNG